jgi:hypothetical protein
MTTLTTTITRVLYPPATDESAVFFILKTQDGIAKGKMTWRPSVNERITFSGITIKGFDYNGDKTFYFNASMPSVPDAPRETLAYIVTRAKGIGPELEKRIWAQCGEEFDQPERLESVQGMTGVRIAAFMEAVESVKRESEKSKTIAWLMSKGATVNMAVTAFDKFANGTIGIVNADPYRLAELDGYSFTAVDGRIRAAFEIGDDDPRRVAAAVVYKLRQLTGSGATVIKYDALNYAVKELIGPARGPLICATVKALFDEGELVKFADTRSLALKRDFINEKLIYDFATNEEKA